jgi:hypothetical protein
MINQARSETEEKVHEAVEAALTSSQSATTTPSTSQPVKPELKRPSETAATTTASGPAKKAKGLWLGAGLDDLDEDDSDLSDSEDEAVGQSKEVAVM